MEKIVLIGTADTARDAYCFIQDYKLFEVIAFAVDRKYKTDDMFCGLPVYCIEELSSQINKTEVGLFHSGPMELPEPPAQGSIHQIEKRRLPVRQCNRPERHHPLRRHDRR